MRGNRFILLVAVLALLGTLAAWWFAPRLIPGLRPARAGASAAGLPAPDSLTAWTNTAAWNADSLAGRAVVVLVFSDRDPRGLAALPVADAWQHAFAPAGARVLAVRELAPGPARGSEALAGFARRLELELPLADDLRSAFGDPESGLAAGPRVLGADERGVVCVDARSSLAGADSLLRAWLARAHPGLPAPPALVLALPQDVRTVALGAGSAADGPLHGLAAGTEQVFTAEFRFQESGREWTPFPVGGWRLEDHGLTATRGGAANFLSIRYSASRVGVVAVPPPGASARLWVLRDDRWPEAAQRGEDVRTDEQGAAWVLVDQPRIYWIARGEGGHVLKVSPDVPGIGLRAFVFEGAQR